MREWKRPSMEGLSYSVPQEDDDGYGERTCHCPECGTTYSGAQRSGGHCRGGKYGGCCQTFGSQTTADKHQVGPYDPPGLRRCLTPDEMRGKGWRLDETGAWRMPAPDNPHWRQQYREKDQTRESDEEQSEQHPDPA